MANAEASVDTVLRRLLDLLDDVERSLRSALADAARMDGASARDRVAVARSVRRQVIAALRSAGAAIEDATKSEALDVAAAAVAAATELEGGFSSNAKTRIARIVSERMRDLPEIWQDAADTIQRAVNAGMVSDANLGELAERVGERLRISAAKAATVIDAAIMGAERAALLEVAEETGEQLVYLYTGPDDGKTRPFCGEHEGRAFTREALDRLDNGAGQPKPVSVFLGGYNCRHSLSPMTVEDALADGIEIVV